MISTLYRSKFEKECIELMCLGFFTAREKKEYSLNWNENDFSKLLEEYINDNPLSLEKNITCKTESKINEKEIIKEKGYADRLPRVDLIYFKIEEDNWNCKRRFEYHMEAKRLKEKNTNLKREYIKEGMDRFILEKYPLGCMLGYLLEGTVDKTIEDINKLLEKYNRSRECLNSKSDRFGVSYYESNHEKIGILKHLMLDFTK